jgi:acetyl-CoA carboxylase biotin carboxylase subunit
MSNIAAAEITNADAIHPGYRFLSENSKFSKYVRNTELNLLSFSEMIDRMGDKASAKATMIEAGVPVVPSWYSGVIRTSARVSTIFGYSNA